MLSSQAGGPTQSQLSRPMSSGHRISMEHRLRKKQLNSDANASNNKYLKEIQEKRKEDTLSSEKIKKRKMKNIKKSKNEEMNKKNEKKQQKFGEKKWEKRKRGPKGVPLPPEMGPKIDFSHKNCQEKS